MTLVPDDASFNPDTVVGRPRPTYQDLLKRDTHKPAEALCHEAYRDLGGSAISSERYTSQAWFDKEVDNMWMKVWQMACRAEEIPNAGDYVLYEIIDRSVIITRTQEGEIRAFINSCLHRGRKLKTEDGHAPNFRCPFHAWTWNLDGSIKSVPCRWDFPQLSDDDLKLPELRVGEWGGFVFVNFDKDAISLEDYLDPLPEHFKTWELENCYKSVHLAGIIHANWKVAQEAFMESYHVIATHPQIMPFFADSNSQYDIYGDHVNRNLGAFGAPSPHMGQTPDEAEVVKGLLGLWGVKNSPDLSKEEDIKARKYLGDMARDAFTRAFGKDHSQVSDAEVLDALVYNVFPNFAPWGGFAPNIIYRWRPNGRDPDSCIMEVMFLKRCPEGKPRPKPVKVRWVEDGTPWADAPELPVLGGVIDQDRSNMSVVQEGLKNSATHRVHLARYEEIRIRHFHQTLAKYVGEKLPGEE